MDKLLKIAYAVVISISIACAFIYTTSSTSGTSYVKDTYSQFDERLAMLEVNSILHPGDGKHFVFYVISGSTLFYGRAMMVIDAIVSFIPDKIWGIEGQVVATRLTHFFILLLAIHLLITMFVKDSLFRLLILVFSVVSPYFIYFSFVPKPEPYVLLFLVFFLKGFIKSNWSFGRHFIWLGLAFGCKISVLPLIPLFFLLPVVYQNQKFQFIFKVMEIVKSGLWMLAGFIACIPCLLLIPVKPVFLQTYLYQSIVSAKKKYDDTSIDFFTWAHHLFYEHYAAFSIVVILAVVFIFVLAFYAVKKERKISNAHLLLAIGLIQVLLIFVLTKRIWPHYIFVGLTISFIAGIALFETVVKEKYKWFSLFLVALILPQTYTFSKDVKQLMERETDPLFMQVKNSGTAAFSYLEKKGVHTIGFDLSTYIPNEKIIATQFYEPFPEQKRARTARIEIFDFYDSTNYTRGYEALVFEKNCPCDSANFGSKEYFMKDAFSSFSKYVPSTYHFDTAFAATKVFLRNDIGK